LAGVFYLAALALLVGGRDARPGAAPGSRSSGARGAGGGPGAVRLALAGLAAACALLSKEMAITLVVVAPLLVLLDPARAGAAGDGTRRAARAAALRTGVVLVAVAVAVAVARRLAMGELTGHMLSDPQSWPARLLNTLGAYLQAIVVPSVTLRLEPPLDVGTWSTATLGGGVLVLGVVALVVATWRRAPVVAFGGLATLIALLPVSQLVPLETAWAERFTYIPAALATIALAGGLARLAARGPAGPARRRRRALLVGLCVALLVFEAAALWHRNRAWRDDETLWNAVLASGRVSAQALNNRGVNLMDRGEFQAAADAYREALALDPAIATAHFNLGIVYWSEGALDSALARVATACALRPHDVDFALKHGSIALAAGRAHDAAAIFQRALELRPDAVEAWIGLATAARRDGRLDRAFTADRRALELEPSSRAARFGLARDHFAAGDLDSCLAWCERLLELEPAHAGALFQRGRVREERGDLDGALADYRASAAADSTAVAVHVRTARVLVALARPCEAAAAFAAAARRAPPGEVAALERAAATLRAACAGGP
ncbi:MAG: tetratricopeptide repeat protein, partial [Candidatus Eiseniibacteriota bacterium]